VTVSEAPQLGVYIHWPYCARICPYCDFNVYAAKARDTAPLHAAILRDLEGWRDRTGPRDVASVFLGGGTPSLLSGAEIEGFLKAVDRLWGLPSSAEVTLEANPDDAARFTDYANAGVDRLSVGVQSLDDARLSFLGRTHDAEEARRALEAARPMFRSLSADLIYATPGQTREAWRAELQEALTLPVDHLSLYHLTIEPGAAFAYAVKRRDWAPVTDDDAADFYDDTQALTQAAGFDAYEISNHACGDQHQSRHNRLYWSSADWVGAGPGAHGRLSVGGERWASVAAEKPGEYLRQVTTQGLGWASVETLSAVDRAREVIAMGLRVAEGFALADVEAVGARVNAQALADLIGQGLVAIGDGRIALTSRGRLLADAVAEKLAP
jgi:oxygen-independent coproporphyrinogen-3 oxidase